jgi:hypothetical protein
MVPADNVPFHLAFHLPKLVVSLKKQQVTAQNHILNWDGKFKFFTTQKVIDKDESPPQSQKIHT